MQKNNQANLESNLNADKYKKTLVALMLYVAWVIGFAFYNFIEEKKQLYQVVDQQLVEAAQLAPLLLDKDLHHKNIAKDTLSRNADIDNMFKLSAFTDKSNIDYIYTLIIQNNKIIFTSSSATEEERKTKEGLTVFFDHYNDVDPRVFDVFKSRKKAFIEYSDQWGTFRSVFIPLYAEDGSLYVSAADMAIGDISAQLQEQLVRTLVIAILFIFFAYPIYFTATRKIKRLAKSLEQKIQQQSTELVNKTERLQLAMKASKQGWFDLNIVTGEVIVSDEYPALLGFSPMSFQTNFQEWQDNIHPDDSCSVLKMFKETIEGSESREVEYRRKNKDGHWQWIHSIGQVIEWDKQKKPYRMVGIHADISERKRSEQVLRTLAESSSVVEDGVFQEMISGLAISQNVSYAFIAKVNENTISTTTSTSSSATTLVAWANNKIIENFTYSLLGSPCEQVLQQGVCFYPENVQHFFPKDYLLEEMGVVSYLGVPLRNSSGKVIGLLSMLDDKPMAKDLHIMDLLGSLAVRVAIELELRESDKQLNLSSQVFKEAHEGIVITDENCLIVDVNPTFSIITCYSREDVIGQNPRILSSGKHSPAFFAEMWQTIAKKGFWRGELWNRKKNGELYAVLFSISSIVDERGNVQNYISLFSDITKSKEQQASLELMAHYDILTGLPNRSLFVDRYKQAIAHSKRFDTNLAVCFLDLDGFKPVNDNYGHIVGDQLLIKVAERIKAQMRAEDTVSRLGGDEFAFLLGDITSQLQCEQMLERLHHTLAQVFIVEGHEILISASSGVTLYPSDDADLDTLLRHADQAMYQAKVAGRNQYQFFDSQEDQFRVDAQQRLKEIEAALLNDEMQLYYQPKVNLKTGVVFGVEALIRWLHPQKGIIAPQDFLPVIEGSALEIKLGEWVINAALKRLDMWHYEGLLLEVSVNISSYHLQSQNFIAHLRAILANHVEIDSRYLQLEILESSALGDLNAISDITQLCRNTLGVQIALDDFGTGYSSLTHLRNLSANTLKIDRSFVKDVLDNANDYAIIEGIIGLANAFKRDVIAEGVESIEDGLMLLAMGCEQAQGYIIAKPMPACEIFDWVNSFQPVERWMQYGKKEHSIVSKELKIYLLCLERWLNLFNDNIRGAPDELKTWPVMNQEKCHHSIRLKQIKQEQILSQELLSKVDEETLSFQLIVNDIFSYYQNGKVSLAREGLDLLNERYKQLSYYFDDAAS